MSFASRGLFIDGAWRTGAGSSFSRTDPAAGQLTWENHAASVADVDAAVAAANAAAPAWGKLTTNQRAAYLTAFGQALTANAAELTEAISLETGKPRWEAKTEFDALVKKIDLTRAALAQRQSPTASTAGNITSLTRYKPLGPAAVLGPFNLPAHLPNGQILPALLAGNTVVFKPSELTPRVGEIYARCWDQAKLPAGVFNMVQGGRDAGAALATHTSIHAVLFTGSRAGGVALSTALAPHPEKLLALEMGGNNPLLALRVANLDAAAYAIIQSAFITAGQRCTCARRLILQRDAEGDRLLARVTEIARHIRVGPYTLSPEPFIGPVIGDGAANRLLEAQSALLRGGANAILPLRSAGERPALLAPGILDVTAVANRPDEELFGPLLQVIRVNDFAEAMREANRTAFGLAAALLSDDRALYEQFYAEIRAGIVNWNQPTTGASSNLAFGGIGQSGNHRPAGFFAIDFCADPVASLEAPAVSLPATLAPGITL